MEKDPPRIVSEDELPEGWTTEYLFDNNLMLDKEPKGTLGELVVSEPTDPVFFLAQYLHAGHSGINALTSQEKETVKHMGLLYRETHTLEPLREFITKYEESAPKYSDGKVMGLGVLKAYLEYLERYDKPTSLAEGAHLVKSDEEQPVAVDVPLMSHEEEEHAEAVVHDMDWQPETDLQFTMAAATAHAFELLQAEEEDRKDLLPPIEMPEIGPRHRRDDAPHEPRPTTIPSRRSRGRRH